MSRIYSDATGECLWCGAEIAEDRWGTWVAHPSRGLETCSESADGDHEPIHASLT